MVKGRVKKSMLFISRHALAKPFLSCFCLYSQSLFFRVVNSGFSFGSMFTLKVPSVDDQYKVTFHSLFYVSLYMVCCLCVHLRLKQKTYKMGGKNMAGINSRTSTFGAKLQKYYNFFNFQFEIALNGYLDKFFT